MKIWSKEKLKKTFAAATLAAFVAGGTVLPAAPAYAADSTHITEEQQAKFSDSSWIQDQADREQKMEKTFQAGQYTAQAPYVVTDPYGNNPLSALVMFKTPTETKVSVKVEIPADKSGAYDAESTVSFDFKEYTKDHYIPVYALFDGKNTVTMTVTDKAGKVETYAVPITTTLPEKYNITANMVTMDQNAVKKDGLNFVCCLSGVAGGIAAFDYNGNYRAVFTNSGMSRIWDMPNGHIGYESGNMLRGYYSTAILESDMMGKVYQKYLVSGVHHEFIQLENGNYLADAELPNANTTEDYFVELDKNTGKAVRDWWLKDSFQLNKYEGDVYYGSGDGAPGGVTEDWAHVNSFVQVPGEDAIWFSARHQDGMYKLNLKTNQIDAIIAENNDANFKAEFSAKRLTPVITQADGSVITVDEWWKNNKELNPTGAAIDWHNPDDPYFKIENTPFEYTYGQHGISLLPNGDIFVFDNGDGRSKDPNKFITQKAESAARETMKTADKNSAEYKEALATNYSRAVIYRYDEKAGTVEQLWQYGKERGMELYSMFICDVDYLGPNHYLIDFGGARSGATMQEGSYARVIEILDGQVINEMNVNSNCYRAERLDPYYGVTGEYELNKVQGVQKGELLMERAVLPGADTGKVTMKIGEKEYFTYNGGADMDAAPYLDGSSRTMIPVRYAGRALGASVVWDADAQTVTVKAGDNTAVFTIGSNEMVVNGETKTIDTAAVIQDGRTMLPLRAAAEALGATVDYADGVITINK